MVSESVLPDCGHDAAEGLLETWAMIEQAKGILMARYRCGLDGAFGLLRRAFRAADVTAQMLAQGPVVAGQGHRAGRRRVP